MLHKILLFVFGVFFFVAPIQCFSKTIYVRDASGRLIEVRDEYDGGNTVRDSSGTIIRTERDSEGETVVRDRNGRVIRIERDQ